MLSTVKTALKVKIETVKGTKVTGDLDTFAENLVLNPDAGFLPLNGTGGVLGNTIPGVYPIRTGVCSCRLPLRGNGSHTDLESGLGAFLQAAGFKATAGSYAYASGFSDQSCLSINEYDDGKLRTLFGAMFDATLEGEVGDVVWINFDGKGRYDDETTVTFPSFTPSARAPMILQAATLSFDSYAFKLSRFAVKLNNQVIMVPDAATPTVSGGFLHALITNYNPQVEFDAEDALVSAYNYYSKLIAKATTIADLPDLTLSLSDGTDKITITLNAVQPMEAPVDDREGIRIRKYVGRLHGDASTPAVTIAVTAP